MTTAEYISSITKRYQLGNATEHTFRGDLQQLIESLVPDVRATNEPKRQSCGAPDYIITRKDIPLGFIEAKDIGDTDLDGLRKSGNKEQFDRYKSALDNLIFTDYLNFHLYREGELVSKIAIGVLTDKGIKPLPENFVSFENTIKVFSTHFGQTIRSPKKLAEMMAGKARLLSDVIEKALTSDEVNHENSSLKEQMEAFKQILIHDITPKGFADVYAQTIAYGMFAARLHDTTLDSFSRQEAAELIPKSNPFLRRLFGYIAGPDIDDRIKWIVDSLTDIFLACDVSQILKNYGKATQMEDPIIHFYETFLSEYDAKLRKSRGVWYTPAPVVNFIVRAVDDILKTEFGLAQGLADTSKTKINVNIQETDKRFKDNIRKVEQEVHKVQILDPATGTGTFLAEVVKQIHKKFEGQQGIWSNYVENHLLPRLNGFELLMASYAMAHLKLDLLLTETGFKSGYNKRFRVFLTNSLEESHPDTGTLFANWLSSEANEANQIKRDTPVMCVIGNPPYAISSSNKGEWIQKLIETYKRNLTEQNINALSDDYVKFIRYGQHFIDKNKNGIMAYVSNNSFLDGIVHRTMRAELLKSFDKIYVVDLHGNSNKKETSPDGSPDKNVFDIKQGVSIVVFVKRTQPKKAKATVFHFDLYGTREYKYKWLAGNSIESIEWSSLKLDSKYQFFVPSFGTSLKIEYAKGFKLDDLFREVKSGVKFRKDNLLVKNHFNRNDTKVMLSDIQFMDSNKFKLKYQLSETKDWTLEEKRKYFIGWEEKDIVEVQYRPFDNRFGYYPLETVNKIITRGDSRYDHMKNMILGSNLGIVIPKQTTETAGALMTNTIIANKSFSAYNMNYLFPLYIYPATNAQQSINQSSKRTPNLNTEIVKQIAEKFNLNFTNEKEETEGTFTPIDIMDYIYAVLHSPTYREKYKEFLKIDFPRVPYPKDPSTFWQLVKLGGDMRTIHLLESPKVEQYITRYPVDGSNEVTRKLTNASPGFEMTDKDQELGKVWINDEQYFEGVPLVAWEFYIGGYQPAQKWLKDRKGRILTFDDILHYQKIIVALTETARLMGEIDKIEIE